MSIPFSLDTASIWGLIFTWNSLFRTWACCWRPLPHLCRIRLPVLEEGLAIALLLDDVAALLVRRLRD
jgi:hypothetical protein